MYSFIESENKSIIGGYKDNVSNAPISKEMKKSLGRIQKILSKNGIVIVGDFDVIDTEPDERLILKTLSGDMYRWSKHGIQK